MFSFVNFLLKYLEAAACYREVLRTAVELESRYGVLADWSQRLHSITNLHWLIQCHDIPLEKPTLEEKAKMKNEAVEATASTDIVWDSDKVPTWDQLDPRVDRDLLWKAKLLRMDYLKVC